MSEQTPFEMGVEWGLTLIETSKADHVPVGLIKFFLASRACVAAAAERKIPVEDEAEFVAGATVAMNMAL